VKNGVIASIKHELTTVVNVESNRDRQFNAKYLLNDEDIKEFLSNGKLKIVNGIWMPFIRSTLDKMENSDQSSLILLETNKRCTNIFNTITIDPNHRMIACCGLTSKYIKYLDLGSVKKHSIQELYDNQFNDFLKIWIATEGPHKIMDFVSKYFIVEFDYKKVHSCQICAIIFNNENILDVIKKNYKDIFTNVILKYSFNKKQINNINNESS
jgi:hypothetical protein